MQYRYTCDKCEVSHDAIDLKVPDYVHCRLPVHITHRAGTDLETLNFIVNGATTSISFSAMKSILSTNRVNLYQEKMIRYYTAVEYFKTRTGTHLFGESYNPIPFSDMGDRNGFNEVEVMSEDYIIDLFKEYISERKETILSYLTKSDIHSVQSLDHTFNISKKTIKISKTSNSSYSKNSIDDNGFLFIMGGDGKITDFVRTKNTQGNSFKFLCKNKNNNLPNFERFLYRAIAE